MVLLSGHLAGPGPLVAGALGVLGEPQQFRIAEAARLLGVSDDTVPVLRAERRRTHARGRDSGARRVGGPPAGAGVPVDDVRADQMVALAAGPLPDAIRRVLDALDPAVGADDELVAAVLADAQQSERRHAGARRP